MKTREKWIDRWRGILILSIVLRHVAGPGVDRLCSGNAVGTLNTLMTLSIAFSLPAFFALAGMCYKPNQEWKSFVCRKVERLLLPYAVFAVFSWIVYDAVYSEWSGVVGQILTTIMGGQDGRSFKCNSVLWFPPAMFTTLVCFRAIESLTRSRNALKLLLCLVLLLLRACVIKYKVSFLPWGINGMIWYAPYFLIGTMVKEWLRSVSAFWLGLVSIVIFIILWLLASTFPLHPLRAGGFSSIQGSLVNIGMGISGSFFSVAVARSGIWDKRLIRPLGRCLIAIGLASLGIMLMHKFPIVAVQERIPIIRAMFGADAALAVLGTFFVVAVATVASYFATVLLRRFAPWAIGERPIGGR